MKKKIRVLVYDTETAGLPKNYKLSAEEDLTNYPYVLQLGAKILELVFDSNNNLENANVVYSLNTLVKPIRGFEEVIVNAKAQAVHGISAEKAKEGNTIENVAFLFQGMNNSVDFIVCHNVNFDKNVMNSELLRLGIEPKYKQGAKIFCSMKYSTFLLKIPNTYNGFKFPKLEELYKYLFNEEMGIKHKAHDAMGDVDATVDCLLKLLIDSKDLRNYFSKTIPILPKL